MKKDTPPRIAENPSLADYPGIMNLLRIFGSARGLIKAIGLSGPKFDSVAAAANEVLAHESILTLPDRFNAAFATRGWIATDSLSLDAMKEAIRLADSGNIGAAEEALAAPLGEEQLRLFAILRSRRFHKVPEREDQLEEALRLFIEGRYWSALPLILVAADGFASDVLGNSPFKEGADLSAFDSIVGHPTGLPSLVMALTQTRQKTRADPIGLPFRHGILHGRDLGYAERVTCAKGWMLYVALVDWAIAKSSEVERRRKDDERRNFSWSALLESLRSNAAARRALDAWVAAPLPETLDPASPEERRA